MPLQYNALAHSSAAVAEYFVGRYKLAFPFRPSNDVDVAVVAVAAVDAIVVAVAVASVFVVDDDVDGMAVVTAV